MRRGTRKPYRNKPYQIPTSAESYQSFFTVEENKQFLSDAFYQTDDLKFRELVLQNVTCLICYLDPLTSEDKLQKTIIKPLLERNELNIAEIVTSKEIRISTNLHEAVSGLTKGFAVFLVDGTNHLYILEAFAGDSRAVTEPVNEQVVRGSHEGFVENIMQNLQMLRRRVENPNLVVKFFKAGKATDTKIAIAYIQNLVNPDLVAEVEKRINAIEADSIQTPGYVEEFIEDEPFSPFPQMLSTERPDRLTAHITEGRVGVFMEGSPSALIMPVTFFAFYQSPEDYNSRWYIGTVLRLIRITSFIFALALPSVYIATVSFHSEILPAELILNIKSSLENVPFPPLIEALIMQITLELLREASIRLPNPIAQTIGIVGGLVIGTAIVEANLVSNMMIIIVALTAISSFAVPSYEMSMSIRLLGFPLMLLSATFGFIGLVFGLSLILIHLCGLETFGTPYFSPLAPFRFNELKDSIIRVPRWLLGKRPIDIHAQAQRQEWFSRRWKRDEDE
ncbi:spore germination protein [Guptibacillus hwajinpoensis]|uniref:Spore germination protein KA n=1 Tax=Guptibacillus hwajinpoensis TaxID=208199 RepID=A0ABU0K4C2_9BACL|nr:spore germination protein [Alkalihalobacillus hemicentroti]MDQ0484206.1 spore germination protein KA [Alkalihalobacillus hemicentroti]